METARLPTGLETGATSQKAWWYCAETRPTLQAAALPARPPAAHQRKRRARDAEHHEAAEHRMPLGAVVQADRLHAAGVLAADAPALSRLVQCAFRPSRGCVALLRGHHHRLAER